ncbi:YmfQ family protein [Ectobacillus ponti]|uniref:YmfQ family protein n=1 Tax=Ectobacillus ponti TaxID=2961894 RepID=A0AA41XDE4_9BACI|nr:YmfQ family protein [Ectobacillus ponti]MCP8970051.1 YmfQ family protein [Ectobacillus ponti]
MSLDIEKDMQDYLPRYYVQSKMVGNLLKQEAAEISLLHTSLESMLAQFFVETATWGLSKWEAVCGIPADPLKPIDQRRSVVLSKLRGTGTVTAAHIKNVTESFENGTVEVLEQFSNYEVIITFVGKRGVPPNLRDVERAVREIVPAHLQVTFKFTYLRWDELDAAKLTWNQLEAMNKTWEELEKWKP